MAIYTGSTAVAVSSLGVWNQNQSHWVAIYLDARTAGTCTIYFNGTQVLTYSGDTAEQVTDNWDQVSFGASWSSPTGNVGLHAIIDDVIITDNDGGVMTAPLPECFGQVIVPDAVISGNLTGVGAGGSGRFANVAERPASQAEYNLAAAISDEDLYSLTTPDTPGIVHAVSIWAEATRSGTITQGAIRTVSGASDTYATAVTLPSASSYGVLTRIHTRNPNGDVAWTVGTLTALQVGFKFS